jgi:hypothetical protein
MLICGKAVFYNCACCRKDLLSTVVCVSTATYSTSQALVLLIVFLSDMAVAVADANPDHESKAA